MTVWWPGPVCRQSRGEGRGQHEAAEVRATWGGGRLRLRGKLLTGVLLWASTQASHRQQGALRSGLLRCGVGRNLGRPGCCTACTASETGVNHHPALGLVSSVTVLLREKRIMRRAISNSLPPHLCLGTPQGQGHFGLSSGRAPSTELGTGDQGVGDSLFPLLSL